MITIDQWRAICSTAIEQAKTGDADAREWVTTMLLRMLLLIVDDDDAGEEWKKR